MAWTARLLTIVAMIAVLLSILVYSAHITAGSHAIYAKLGSAEGVDAPSVTGQLIGYLHGNGAMPDLFNEEERSHLGDVRGVFAVSLRLLAWAVAYLVILSIAALRNYVAAVSLARGARWGAWAAIVVVLLAGIVPFDAFFTAFHNIFFPQGNWQFPVDSTLIQLYPESFWMYAGVQVGILVVIFSALVLLASRVVQRQGTWRQKTRKSRSTPSLRQ